MWTRSAISVRLASIRCHLYTVLFDIGWVVASAVDAGQTERLAQRSVALPRERGQSLVRGARVEGLNGRLDVVLANLGAEEERYPLASVLDQAASALDLVNAESLSGVGELTLKPLQVRVFELQR